MTLADFNGITIGVDESINGLQFGLARLQDSASLIQELLIGTLKLTDGALSYETGRAINLLKDNVDQLTKDGKRIITASDRPAGHYRHYSSNGDDLQNGIRGNGQALIFIVPPGETSVIDTAFIDDIYIKDGTVAFEKAAIGSHISVDIVAPAGFPYPAIFQNGNFDVVNGSWIPNAANTGSYFINPESETVFLRFMNRHLLLGTYLIPTSAPEPSFLPQGCIQRFTLFNSSTSETLNAVVAMGLYRISTL